MIDIKFASVMRYHCAKDASGDFEKVKTFFDLWIATITDNEAKRAARAAKTDDELKAAKMRVGMWYTGGSVFGQHNAENSTPNGSISIDIDDVEPERQIELKARLSRIPCVFFAAVSVSGKGLYAIASVSEEVQRDPEKISKLLSIIDAAVLHDRKGNEHIDTSCRDLARRRFESYDPECYFDESKAANEYRGDIRERCRAAYDASAIAAIAKHFGGRGDAGPGSAQAGLAIAGVAVAAGGRVHGRIFDRNYYPSRAQVVILGDSGAGKSTGAAPLMKASSSIGARPVAAESDRALELALVESGLAKTGGAGTDDDWTQICPPVPLLSITDEAGDEARSRQNREYKSKIASIKRRTYDTVFHASKSLTTKLPQKDFYCSYTDVQLSTPRNWADAIRGVDSTAGDARRILEFWAEGVEAAPGAMDADLAQFAAADASPQAPANVEAISAVLDALKSSLPAPGTDGASIKLDGIGAVESFDMLEALFALKSSGAPMASAKQDVRTMLCGLATAIAWSNGTDRIDRQAIEAAWAVIFAVYENRSKLIDIAEVGAVTHEAEITAEILAYVGAREIRASSVKRMLARRGTAYTRAYAALIEAGALVVGKGKSPTVRAATEAEAEAAADRQGAPKPEPPSVWNGTARTAEESYAKCDEFEKKKRLAAYLTEHEKEHPVVAGNRDNSLRSLSAKLGAAGMKDDTARAWFWDLCDSVGFTDEKDKARLWRGVGEKTPGKT